MRDARQDFHSCSGNVQKWLHLSTDVGFDVLIKNTDLFKKRGVSCRRRAK